MSYIFTFKDFTENYECVAFLCWTPKHPNICMHPFKILIPIARDLYAGKQKKRLETHVTSRTLGLLLLHSRLRHSRRLRPQQPYSSGLQRAWGPWVRFIGNARARTDQSQTRTVLRARAGLRSPSSLSKRITHDADELVFNMYTAFISYHNSG